MKKIIPLLFLFGTAFLHAQDTIPTAKVNDYLNKEVWVKGTVAAVKFAEEGAAFHYINIDKAFPDNVFTVALTTKYAERLKIDLKTAKGKKILVKGRITIDEKSGSKVPQMFNPSKILIGKQS